MDNPLRNPDWLVTQVLRTDLSHDMSAHINAAIACYFKFRDLRPAHIDDFEGKFGYSPGSIKCKYGFLQADNYTGNLLCALKLAEEQIPGVWWVIAKGRCVESEPLYGCRLMFGEECIGEGEHNASAARAILLALFRGLTKLNKLPSHATQA